MLLNFRVRIESGISNVTELLVRARPNMATRIKYLHKKATFDDFSLMSKDCGLGYNLRAASSDKKELFTAVNILRCNNNSLVKFEVVIA